MNQEIDIDAIKDCPPRAFGWVAGVVHMEPDSKNGKIVLDDGTEIPCVYVSWRVSKFVKAGERQILKVFPDTQKKYLILKIAAAFTKEHRLRRLDQFNVRGTIDKVKNGRIRLNVFSTFKKRTFKIEVAGFLPSECQSGQFWELDCEREGKDLVMVDGKKISDTWPPPPAEVGKKPPAHFVSMIETALVELEDTFDKTREEAVCPSVRE